MRVSAYEVGCDAAERLGVWTFSEPGLLGLLKGLASLSHECRWCVSLQKLVAYDSTVAVLVRPRLHCVLEFFRSIVVRLVAVCRRGSSQRKRIFLLIKGRRNGPHNPLIRPIGRLRVSVHASATQIEQEPSPFFSPVISLASSNMMLV